DRQVADQDVGLRLAQGLGDVDGGGLGLLDGLPVVLAQAVVGGAALHGHAQRRYIGNLDRVVLAGGDRFGDVEPDLFSVYVEGGHELDVIDVVRPELHVHEARDGGCRVRAGVEMHALHQRSGAVAESSNGHTNSAHRIS